MWHEENIEIIEYLDKSNPKDLASTLPENIGRQF